MSTTIDSLALELTSNASSATNGLNSLLASLGRLKTATQSLTSNSKKATTGVNTLTKSFDKLKTATDRLNTQSTQTNKKLGTLTKTFNKLKTASSGVSSAVSSSKASFTELYHTLKSGYIIGKKLSDAIGAAMTKTNKYIEDINLFDVAMGQYAANARIYAEEVGAVMGIDPADWMRNQGVFMTLATGFGVAGDRAAVMSEQLAQLGYDLSSLYNLSTADAMQKLQSGLAGELEPLRRLGFDLSKAKLEEIAKTLGITKKYADMTQAEKSQLRYYAILTQVTEAQGDMARTLEAPANQLRIFNAQVEQAGRAIGSIFIPMLQRVLPYAIAAARVVRDLANAIASLVGFQMPEIDYSGLEVVEGEVEDVEDALDDATASAKKFKNFLLGIDELNVISSNKTSGTDTSLASQFNFELPTYDFLGGATSQKIDEIVQKMKEWLGIDGEITSWADLFHTKLGEILKTAGLIAGVLLLWKFSTGFMDALNLLSKLFESGLSQVIAGVTLTLTGVILLIDSISSVVVNGKLDENTFVELLGGAAAVTAGAALIGKALGSAIIGGAIGAIAGGVALLFAGLWDSLTKELNWLNGMCIVLGATLVGAGIGAFFGPVGIAIGAIIGLVVGAIADAWIYIIQNWDEVKAKALDIWDKIVAWAKGLPEKVGYWMGYALGFALKALYELGLKIREWWSDKALPFIKSIPEKIKEIPGKIQEAIIKLWTKLTELPGKALQLGKDIFNNIIQGLKDAVSSAGKALSDFGTGFLNGLKSALGIEVKVNGTKGSTGKFAAGGFPDTGELFVAREAGPELVGSIGNRTAVANNDQIVAAVSEGVYQAVSRATSNNGGNTVVQLLIDGEIFYQKVLEKNRREIIRTGANPMLI